MSSGNFVNTVYEASYGSGVRHPIRTQPEVLEAAFGSVNNDGSADPANNPISATISRGRRAKGLIPRTVTLRLTEGATLANYKPLGVTKIPIFQFDVWTGIAVGSICVYLGVDWEVIGKSPELAR